MKPRRLQTDVMSSMLNLKSGEGCGASVFAGSVATMRTPSARGARPRAGAALRAGRRERRVPSGAAGAKAAARGSAPATAAATVSMTRARDIGRARALSLCARGSAVAPLWNWALARNWPPVEFVGPKRAVRPQKAL